MGIKGSRSRVTNRKAFETNMRRIFSASHGTCEKCGALISRRLIDDEEMVYCSECGKLVN